jgi:hypothetical protein
MSGGIIPADMARALLEAATPGPWMHNWRGPEDGAPGDLWHTGGCGGPLTRVADWELAAQAPDLAATVVALHAEVERMRAILPPERERGQGIVGEGSWAVFAERVAAERDAAREHARQATAAERARIVAWLKERADKAYAVGNEPYGNALLNASRILETSEATP